jgi:ketosteroid isomerase-like protein
MSLGKISRMRVKISRSFTIHVLAIRSAGGPTRLAQGVLQCLNQKFSVVRRDAWRQGPVGEEEVMKKYGLAVGLIGLFGVSPTWGQTRGTEQELIALEHTWKDAVVKRDAAALQRLYADEYVSTDQEGLVWTKAQDIAIDTDTAAFSRVMSYKLDDLKVRVYGDVAVVTGLNMSKGTLFGKAASTKSRFTDVFVKRDGHWQCVANQATSIIAEP